MTIFASSKPKAITDMSEDKNKPESRTGKAAGIALALSIFSVPLFILLGKPIFMGELGLTLNPLHLLILFAINFVVVFLLFYLVNVDDD